MELAGKVKWFDARKGYGFIEASDGSGDVFAHQSDIAVQGVTALEPGDRVKFDLGATPYGRRALRVRRVEPAAP